MNGWNTQLIYLWTLTAIRPSEQRLPPIKPKEQYIYSLDFHKLDFQISNFDHVHNKFLFTN